MLNFIDVIFIYVCKYCKSKKSILYQYFGWGSILWLLHLLEARDLVGVHDPQLKIDFTDIVVQP